MIKNILLPNLGEGVESADVSEVLVKPGDQVTEDTPILVLESEKATMEIPAEMTGTIKEIFVDNSEQISTGQKLMSIEIGSDEKSKKLEADPKPEEKEFPTISYCFFGDLKSPVSFSQSDFLLATMAIGPQHTLADLQEFLATHGLQKDD